MGIFKTLGTIIGGPIVGRLTGTIMDHTPTGSITNSLIDNVFKDKVLPVEGSIVHCSLYGVEHTGVYVGNGKIAELLGTGEIRLINPKGFINGTNAISIYIACDNKKPIGSKTIANRAISHIGKQRDYHILYDNCHQFASGCITGQFSDGKTLFWMLEKTISKHLNNGRSITWRVWDID